MEIGAAIRRKIVYFAKQKTKKYSKVLVYHDIHDDIKYTSMSTSINQFTRHINIIRDMGFEIVKNITKPENQIQITFDDAFLGTYNNFFIIERLNVPITIFVITSYLNNVYPYINHEQLNILNKSSLVGIGSHTHSHRKLNILSQKNLLFELRKSKQMLEDLLSVKITDLCYPEGKFSKKVIKIATDLGYDKQFSLIPGRYDKKLFKNVQRRSLVQHADDKEFENILMGGDNILEKWYMFKHYLS